MFILVFFFFLNNRTCYSVEQPNKCFPHKFNLYVITYDVYINTQSIDRTTFPAAFANEAAAIIDNRHTTRIKAFLRIQQKTGENFEFI